MLARGWINAHLILPVGVKNNHIILIIEQKSKVRRSDLIGLSAVITSSKYVHVSTEGGATSPRHGGRNVTGHVEHLPSENRTKQRKLSLLKVSRRSVGGQQEVSRRSTGVQLNLINSYHIPPSKS